MFRLWSAYRSSLVRQARRDFSSRPAAAQPSLGATTPGATSPNGSCWAAAIAGTSATKKTNAEPIMAISRRWRVLPTRGAGTIRLRRARCQEAFAHRGMPRLRPRSQLFDVGDLVRILMDVVAVPVALVPDRGPRRDPVCLRVEVVDRVQEALLVGQPEGRRKQHGRVLDAAQLEVADRGANDRRRLTL